MSKLFLVGIIVLALLLRVVDLSLHPVGFTPDEASFGYDAYSLLKTGKDQWGQPWPIVFKSFGDFKLPVYTYLAMPSIALFGLNEISTRLPSAIIGTLAVLVTYLLVKEMFREEKQRGEKIALLASFLLAISPWHLPLSRGAFEANLTSFFMPLGVLLFLKGLRSAKYLPFAVVFFGINMFTYHSARFITPLIALALLFEYKNKIFKLTRTVGFAASVILTLLFSAAIIYSFQLGSGTRLGSSSIFSLSTQAGEDRYLLVQSGLPSNLGLIFYNKYVFIVEKFFTQYASYFSPQFLFTYGAGEGTYGMYPGVGVMYIFELVFLVCFVIWYTRTKARPSWLIFWIIVSPIPAALSTGLGSAANRAAVMLPAIQIISAIGGVYLYDSLKSRFAKPAVILLFPLVVFICFSSFFVHYWYGQRVKQANSMIYGVHTLYSKIETYPVTKPIVISKKISEPHIFIAFYEKMEPSEYQKWSRQWDYKGSNFNWVDQLPVYKLGRYTFKSIDWVADLNREDTLVIGFPDDFVPDEKTDFIVYSTNGTKSYVGIVSKN